MRKHQNRIDKTRSMLDTCRKHGILVQAGLMVSATTDDADYIASIPDHLSRVGMHLPTFLCFESPIPGTPYFHAQAATTDSPPLMPDTHLYDYAGYSVVVRPRRETLPTFVESYKAALTHTFTPWARLRKLWADVPSLLSGGYWDTAMVDILQNAGLFFRRQRPDRTYIPGTDVIPPELTSVPLSDDDFDSDAQRRAIMEPWRVTDARGRVLPQWRESQRVYGRAKAGEREAAAPLMLY
jgi:hypothetical protein